MPAFYYKAVTADGLVREGEMQASDQADVIARLHKDGYLPIRAEKLGGYRIGRYNRQWFRKRRSGNHVLLFTQALATLLHAGLPLDRSLSMLADLADDEATRNVALSTGNLVKGGASLSTALEEQNGYFSPMYINIVKSGESSGALDAVLEQLAEYLVRAKALRDAIFSALLYPTILVAVTCLSVIFLLLFVVPQFAPLFEGTDQALPLTTQLVIWLGESLRSDWWVLVLIFMAAILTLRRQLTHPAGRDRWDRSVLKLPLVSELVRKNETARFCRMLGTLLHNGVAVLAALTLAREALSNRVLINGLDSAIHSLKGGKGLAEPLIKAGVFPALAVQLIQVGEESGELDRMLLQVADIYDREVKTTLQRLIGLVEPVLIIGLGLFIAGIIMSILLAIISVNDLAF